MFSKLRLRMKERTQNTSSIFIFLVSLSLMRSRWDIPNRRRRKDRKEGKWREKKKDQQNFYIYEPMVYLLLLLLWLHFLQCYTELCALCVFGSASLCNCYAVFFLAQTGKNVSTSTRHNQKHRVNFQLCCTDVSMNLFSFIKK